MPDLAEVELTNPEKCLIVVSAKLQYDKKQKGKRI